MRKGTHVIIALALCAAPLPAAAQIGNPADIANRLNRLENEVQTLSRQVYRGSNGEQQSRNGGQLPPATAANMELRLSQLESELRRLTGQVEQQGFAIQEVRDQLNRLMANLDYRLQSLESREAAGGGQGQNKSEQSTAAQPGMSGQPKPSQGQRGQGQPSPGTGNGATSPGAASAPNQPQIGNTLGTLPRGQATGSGTRQAEGNAGSGIPPQADGSGVATAGQSGQQSARVSQPQFETPEALYEEAFAALGRSDFAKAERLFQRFIGQYPEHRLGGNARYWLSETYYARGSDQPEGEGRKRLLEEAAVGFAEGYQTQPRGPKAADNLLKLAMTLGALDRTEDACNALSQLQDQFPDLRGLLARQAERQRSQLGCGG